MRFGLILIAGGLAMIALNYAAAAIFPDVWGGPNIGGGLIVLAAAILVVVGLVVVLVDAARRARSSRTRR